MLSSPLLGHWSDSVIRSLKFQGLTSTDMIQSIDKGRAMLLALPGAQAVCRCRNRYLQRGQALFATSRRSGRCPPCAPQRLQWEPSSFTVQWVAAFANVSKLGVR